MKKKFLQFFTGKLSKSIYIAVASAVVCGTTVVGSIIVVHNHNQEIQMENTASESVTETVTESATENTTENTTEGVTETSSVTAGKNTTARTQAANIESTGERALQYIAEYDRITADYEAKRAALVKQRDEVPYVVEEPEPFRDPPEPPDSDSKEDMDAFKKELEQYFAALETAANEAKAKQAAKQAEIQKQIDTLDAQYARDVAALKAQYGIA